MARLLTRLQIQEVSAVDKGAGENCKVVLWKRDIAQPKAKSFTEALQDQQAAADQRDDDDNPKPNTEHGASKLADLLVESGSQPHRTAALHHLMHTARGNALLRQHKRNEETSMQDPEMTARLAIEKRDTPWTREEFDAEINKRAKTIGKSFAWVCEHDEVGKLLLRAQRFAKVGMVTLRPTFVGGEQVNPDDAAEAYDKLMAMAEAQRAKSPFLTVAEAFRRVFQDPANRELAQRAHVRPAPTTNYPHPR